MLQETAPGALQRLCAYCREAFRPRNRDARIIFCGRLCNDRAQQVRRYGLTVDDYWKMFDEQGGRCAICQEARGRRELAIDHCHTTGRVRGLLCNRCNPGLGNFRDDVARLRAAIAYLESRSA